MTRSIDDKLDHLVEKVDELTTSMTVSIAILNDWRITHTKEHENMTSWKRWVMPFVLSIGMLCWQVFKK
jgi:hypothetical protein